MPKRYKVFNTATGEVQDNLTVRQVEVELTAGFVMLYQTAHQQLYRDPTLTKAEMRVFGFLRLLWTSRMRLTITLTGIAHDLSMHTSEVSRAIKSLITRQVISKIQHPGKYPVYRVNSEYSRKGRQLKAVK